MITMEALKGNDREIYDSSGRKWNGKSTASS